MPSVPQCGNIIGTFDNQTQFDADWFLSGMPGQLTAVNGEAFLTLGAGDTAVFAATSPGFALKSCAVWVQIVKANATNDAMVRLSIANPFGTSRFSIGVLSPNLATYTGDTSLFSVPYSTNSMSYVRMREENGMIHFGYSADARCWTETNETPNTLSGTVEARIAVTHVPSGTGSAGDGKFDNYCVKVP